MSELRRVCLLGFGEVGQVLAAALSKTGATLAVYDRQFIDRDSPPSRALQHFPDLRRANKAEAAVANVDLVISAVTAEQDYVAAQAVAGGLTTGAWFLDLNSVSPATKRKVAVLIEEAGGRYVEAAVMSPIQPQGIASPLLLGGPEGEELLPLLRRLGFTGAKFYHRELGRAAASKMCRSIMIKGLEALLTEGLLTARYYGVEEEVLSSLENLMPGVAWNQHAAYMISRSLVHGTRRAEEMREAASTVGDAGLPAPMSQASAETQEWTAQFAGAAADKPLTELLDAVLTICRQLNSTASQR